MPAYAYTAATDAGRRVRGVEDAASEAAVERALASRGLYPLRIETADDARPVRSSLRGRRADTILALRHLSTLVEGGFTLDRALETTARVSRRADVAEALRDVRRRVVTGAPLGDALAEHPKTFPRLAVGMARAGERGGHLAISLHRLAEQLEREQALRSRLLSAALYPALMAVVGTAAVIVLLTYVLPRFGRLLADAGADLPRSTAALVGLGDLLARGWPVATVAVGAAVVGFAAYRRTADGRDAIDRVLLRLPVIGPLRAQAAAARLGRSLATLLGGGLPILRALKVAAGGLGDAAAAAEVDAARERVRTGGELAAALALGDAFPYLFVQMVEVGERSGRLPDMLERASDAMEQDLERTLERLVRLAEPVLVIVFGIAIGFVALALLQAIYGVRADAF